MYSLQGVPGVNKGKYTERPMPCVTYAIETLENGVHTLESELGS